MRRASAPRAEHPRRRRRLSAAGYLAAGSRLIARASRTPGMAATAEVTSAGTELSTSMIITARPLPGLPADGHPRDVDRALAEHRAQMADDAGGCRRS